MLKRSSFVIKKELDLQKFLHKQRVAVTALLSLLKPRQNHFVDDLSKLKMREDSDQNFDHTESENTDWAKESMVYAAKMVASQDAVDKRLLGIMMIRQNQR